MLLTAGVIFGSRFNPARPAWSCFAFPKWRIGFEVIHHLFNSGERGCAMRALCGDEDDGFTSLYDTDPMNDEEPGEFVSCVDVAREPVDFRFGEARIVLQVERGDHAIFGVTATIADKTRQSAALIVTRSGKACSFVRGRERRGGDDDTDHATSAAAAMPKTIPSTRRTPVRLSPFRLQVVPMTAPTIAAPTSHGK